MVSIDFRQYKVELRKILLVRKESLEIEWDPFLAAWICYALSTDNTQNNCSLAELCEKMVKWIEEDTVWEMDRNVGAVAATLQLCNKLERKKKSGIASKLNKVVLRLDANDKWSPLSDPEQVYLLALGSKLFDTNTLDYLKSIAHKEMRQGLLRKRILYVAALRELGEGSAVIPQDDPQDAGDIITMVWWAERYGGDKNDLWIKFSNIKENISLDEESASDTQRILSVPEIAMLYEAVTKETINPDPIILFENFPLHERIRKLAEDHFKNGKYVAAVFEATKALNEKIQERSGILDKSEVNLVQFTMNLGKGKQPLIRFNDELRKRSGRNEQIGVENIFEGVFKAFRNPKGHEPEDKKMVQLDPYEALEQLIIINYLMKRLIKASLEKRTQKSDKRNQ